MEQQQKREAEEKMKKDMAYGAFQPNPMMNPAFMQYATGMPGFRPMGFGPSPYATNMAFPGMRPMMNPMFPPRVPFPMAPLIPQVKISPSKFIIADQVTPSSCS